MIGLRVVLGAAPVTGAAICQIPGDAYCIATEDLPRLVVQHKGVLFRQFFRYTQALFGQTVQITAGNQLHSTPARLGRWLLMAHDRVKHDTFPLIQEFLG